MLSTARSEPLTTDFLKLRILRYGSWREAVTKKIGHSISSRSGTRQKHTVGTEMRREDPRCAKTPLGASLADQYGE